MCGIAGFINSSTKNKQDSLNTLQRMTGALMQRGPDDGGYWTDECGTVACGPQTPVYTGSVAGMPTANGIQLRSFCDGVQRRNI